MKQVDSSLSKSQVHKLKYCSSRGVARIFNKGFLGTGGRSQKQGSGGVETLMMH